MTKSPTLRLFYYDTCPFCVMVLKVIQQLNLKVEMCHIFQDEKFRNELYEDTGRHTVPCLYIDGTPMHESYDICQWLKSNVDQLEKD